MSEIIMGKIMAGSDTQLARWTARRVLNWEVEDGWWVCKDAERTQFSVKEGMDYEDGSPAVIWDPVHSIFMSMYLYMEAVELFGSGSIYAEARTDGVHVCVKFGNHVVGGPEADFGRSVCQAVLIAHLHFLRDKKKGK